MNIDLTDTTSGRINQALIQARRAAGTPTVGMVLTLVIATDEENAHDALKAASEASQEHPCRILVVIRRPRRAQRRHGETRLDAEVRVGGDSAGGETVLLRLHGELAGHADSVVLPLLLPDAPVVVWWPEEAPQSPAEDPLGALAQRRITDAVTAETPVAALGVRAASYRPGDTDLAWTRITPWRSMLAAAFDQRPAWVTSAVVEGESDNPSVELLALWLADRLHVPVQRLVSDGPGLTSVRLRTEGGEVVLDRPDGLMATLSMPDQPDRQVALKRREIADLIAEELRRLDPDDTYAAALRVGVDQLLGPGELPAGDPEPATAGTAAKAGSRSRAKASTPAAKTASATRVTAKVDPTPRAAKRSGTAKRSGS